ncbi:type II toxin-antitoxin system HicA family toxin [Planosporangium thailandense]|uniref:Type II toxin-antitoxin system HicA family toxin n=1 Tax=Planosporangium thailandense TaxID=765197 RepID=A0ABX0XZM0_9ACTN|nr:type II toxin-antitoxin system HicA family toxin [Planosporangium thailandense]NJC71238.1 type II toxin-antitoxin system HicA family toxin [Planosporangium thailandense]
MVFKSMKRRDIEAALTKHDCAWLRSGGQHDIWICPCGQHQAPVPRHTTISAGVVASIEKKLSCLPRGWLS